MLGYFKSEYSVIESAISQTRGQEIGIGNSTN